MDDLLKRLSLLRWASRSSVIATGLLLVIGVLFVCSACYASDDHRYLYLKQLGWMVVGAVCFTAFAVTDYRKLRMYSWWIYGGCILLLVVVLFAGTKLYGARRWLSLPGGLGVQPSELAKLAVVIIFARMLSDPGASFHYLKPVTQLLVVVGVPFLLIFMEPDLGSAMILAPVAFIMMLVGGVPFRTLGILLAIAVVAAGGIVVLALLSDRAATSEAKREKYHMLGLREHQRDRILVYLRPDKDPLGLGYNKRQSEIAVGAGGAWGKGWGKGTQNMLGFLPRSVAPTDFIFSVIAEEEGFFGSFVLLGLFGLIVVSGMRTAINARDRLGRLLCVGVVAVIFCHVFINMAMTVGILPIVGIPLPLLSYGGSFMVVTMSALGIVQSVRIYSSHA